MGTERDARPTLNLVVSQMGQADCVETNIQQSPVDITMRQQYLKDGAKVGNMTREIEGFEKAQAAADEQAFRPR